MSGSDNCEGVSCDMENSDLKELYIIGAGGLGREVAWMVERINEVKPTWEIRGFIDENESLWNEERDGYRVLGGCEYLKSLGPVYAVCAIGASAQRKAVVQKMTGGEIHFATLVDPSVILSKRVIIGEGSVIFAGSVLTIDITIGRHTIINWHCGIGHDVVLEDYVTLYPGAHVSGKVTIGECVECGSGSRIIQGKTIAEHTIIGAGGVVIQSITEGGTYVGVPVRRIK